jgi:hypothetical protein
VCCILAVDSQLDLPIGLSKSQGQRASSQVRIHDLQNPKSSILLKSIKKKQWHDNVGRRPPVLLMLLMKDSQAAGRQMPMIIDEGY